MTLALLVLLALMFGLSFPAWHRARSHGKATPLVLFLALPALIVWFVLSINGFGAQSLSNLIEVSFLLAAGVALAYLHLVLASRSDASPRAIALWMMAGLVVAAVLLRRFMPVLPE